MSLLYSLIARDQNGVLSEYSEYTGNFLQISRIFLQKYIFQNENRGAIIYNKYKIHYINNNKITFFCLSEEYADERAFAFLEKVQDEVLNEITVEQLNSINIYKFEKGNEILEKNMKLFNSNTIINAETTNNLEDSEGNPNYVVKDIKDLDKDMKMDLIFQKGTPEELEMLNKNILQVSHSFKQNEETSRKNKYVTFAGIIVGIIIIIFIFIQ